MTAVLPVATVPTFSEGAAVLEMMPPDHADAEARSETARKLRPCARRLLLKELAGLPTLQPMEQRDWPRFIEAIEVELSRMRQQGHWPAPVFEVYSADTPSPRSAELVEALQYLYQTDRTAIIMDSAPWTRSLPWLRDTRIGYTAVLLVF